MIDVYYLVNANLRDLCTGDQSVCRSCRMLDDFFAGVFVIELDIVLLWPFPFFLEQKFRAVPPPSLGD